jgi:hypothetical protein
MMRQILTVLATLSLLGLVFAAPLDASAQGKSREKGNKAQKGERGRNAEKVQKKRKGKSSEKAKQRAEEKAQKANSKGEKTAEKAHKGEKGNKGERPTRGKKAAGPDFDQKTTNELDKHAKRMAKIQRIREIARENDNEDLAATASKLQEQEQARHMKRTNPLGYEAEQLRRKAKAGEKGNAKGAVKAGDEKGEKAESE